MKQFTFVTLSLLLLIAEAFAVASPSFRSIEADLSDTKQSRFEQQIKKQITFRRFYNSYIETGDPSGPVALNPHQEVLIFLRDHGKMNLDSYLKSEKNNCWVLQDFDQFQLSYTSLNNISKKYINDPSGFRDYFHELENFIEAKTGQSADKYIRQEKRVVKKLARKLGCNQ